MDQMKAWGICRHGHNGKIASTKIWKWHKQVEVLLDQPRFHEWQWLLGGASTWELDLEPGGGSFVRLDNDRNVNKSSSI
jgi:hypothetical protein